MGSQARSKRIEDHPGVVAARKKYDDAKAHGGDHEAREVELEAARIEAEEPAVDTATATARAKANVGHADPFHTAGYGGGSNS